MNSLAPDYVQIGDRFYNDDGTVEENGMRWTPLAPLDEATLAELRAQGLEWKPAPDEEGLKQFRKSAPGTWRGESTELTEEEWTKLEAELEIKKAKWVLARETAFQQWQIDYLEKHDLHSLDDLKADPAKYMQALREWQQEENRAWQDMKQGNDPMNPRSNVVQLASQKKPKEKLILSSAELVKAFVPPEYLVVGLLQRRFIYSFTGQTGAGKTAILLYLAASTALGMVFAGRETKKARVLYLVSENSDDIIMRWIALADKMKFDLDTIEVYFVRADVYRLKLSNPKHLVMLSNEAYDLSDFGLVIVDTGPAFFMGDDENANAQIGAHARLLRSLIMQVPGSPCVVVSCHPPKHATEDQLLPRGGGAFIAEVDGNLTAAKKGSIVTVHWQGKFRGPDFASMNFLIETVTSEKLKDGDGRHIPTVIVKVATEQDEKAQDARSQDEERTILALIQATPDASFGTLAEAAGWFMHDGKPNKMRALRAAGRLEKAKLIRKEDNGEYHLTKKGETALSEPGVL
jgi:hypothetical protein